MGHEKGRQHIPNRLRRYRRIMGYTQKEVAFFLGFRSTSKISQWEDGKRMPSSENLLRLSVLYCTLPNELYPEVIIKFKHTLDSKQKALLAMGKK